MEGRQQRDKEQHRTDEDRRESKLCDELQDFDGADRRGGSGRRESK